MSESEHSEAQNTNQLRRNAIAFLRHEITKYMFEFKILSLQEANELDSSWPTHMISLIDPGCDVPRRDNHLVLHFDDIDMEVPDDCVVVAEHGVFAPRRKWVTCKQSDIDQVLAFTKDLTDADRLVVHCHAGISRSTAIMLLVLQQHGIGAKEAVEMVKANRSCLWPNALVVEMVDAHFQLDGRLNYCVAELKKALDKDRLVRRAWVEKKGVEDMKKWLDLLG